jgi:KUP system potassium uptake protein
MQQSHIGTLPIIATLGVVYGDIGTSPLYAIKECFTGTGIALTEANILGVLSLIFWVLMLVVTIKYVTLIMRAHNHGEGGILALLALISHRRLKFVSTHTLIALGLIGAALFWGDTLITPAISVLSALEGLTIATPKFSVYIVPAAVVVIVALFMLQAKGTDRIGSLFGPIMLVWFVVIGLLGGVQVWQNLSILKAVNPWYGFHLACSHPYQILLLMGFVVLCVTGAEALYADMGHFGAKAIRFSWLALVCPCLVLNYFGQGAALLHHPGAISNPFFYLVPEPYMLHMVGLATVASIIASQSVISGLFSLCGQAIQLDYVPRMRIIHTSAQQIGRIYIPAINWLLMIGVLAVVLVFKDSNHLAAAYGFSVSGVMVITSLLAMVAMLRIFRWKLWAVLLTFGPLLLIDSTFLVANSLKFTHGAWVPIAFGGLVWSIMHVWHRQRKQMADKTRKLSLSFSQFFVRYNPQTITRVPGTAVFLSKDIDHVPLSLIKHLEHTNCLSQRVIILSILNHSIPRVPNNERIFFQDFSNGFVQVVAHYGFMQSPKISTLLRYAQAKGLDFDMNHSTFFLLHTVPVLGKRLKGWRGLSARLFRYLLRNTTRAAHFFEIPHQRVMELGIQIMIH